MTKTISEQDVMDAATKVVLAKEAWLSATPDSIVDRSIALVDATKELREARKGGEQ